MMWLKVISGSAASLFLCGIFVLTRTIRCFCQVILHITLYMSFPDIYNVFIWICNCAISLINVLYRMKNIFSKVEKKVSSFILMKHGVGYFKFIFCEMIHLPVKLDCIIWSCGNYPDVEQTIVNFPSASLLNVPHTPCFIDTKWLFTSFVIVTCKILKMEDVKWIWHLSCLWHFVTGNYEV